jgi:hypothetical protein
MKASDLIQQTEIISYEDTGADFLLPAQTAYPSDLKKTL